MVTETLDEIGNRLAESLGVGALGLLGHDLWMARVRLLCGLPETWFGGWFEDSASVLVGRWEDDHDYEAASVATVIGHGVSRHDRELSWRALVVWHLSPPPRPVELDAWAVTVLSSWGWRVVGSQRGSSGSTPP